jgi:pyruvate dehydrogenase E2 component (dihydrolipoamide acetyltransferase)
MPIAITIPRLGWNMEEGVFGGWLKADGDTVRAGDRLFVLESDKSNEEIESFDGGILRIPADGPKTGDKVAVGAVIGYLAESVGLASPTSVGQASSLPLSGQAGSLPHGSEPAASPAVRRLARQRGMDLAKVNGSGPGGRIEAADLEPPASRERQRPEPTRRAISPRARRVARELGIDVTKLRGTGSTGRVRESDVRAVQAHKPAANERLIPHTPIRRAIAARLVESQRQTVPVTLTTSIDATNLVNLRTQFKNASADVIPSFTDILVKLCAIALRQHPLLSGQWTDAGIRLPEAIHVGIAVDTDAGLLVPVIRDVLTLDIRQLAARSRELIERARQGKLSTSDMQGGCFTISNLGSYGIDAFTPIINYPESAVLGAGRIARRPMVVGETIVARDQLTLSLTFDHRIVDGAPAARFLQTMTQLIENPPAT